MVFWRNFSSFVLVIALTTYSYSQLPDTEFQQFCYPATPGVNRFPSLGDKSLLQDRSCTQLSCWGHQETSAFFARKTIKHAIPTIADIYKKFNISREGVGCPIRLEQSLLSMFQGAFSPHTHLESIRQPE